MYCRGCHYDLRHLSESRCPECGRGFDPLDRATFTTRPLVAWIDAHRRVLRKVAAGALTMLILVGINAPRVLLMDCVCIDNRGENLRDLVLRWRAGLVFPITDADGAVTLDGDIEPSASLHTQRRAILAAQQWDEWAKLPPIDLWATALAAGAIALATRRWVRRVCCGAAVVAALLAVGVTFREQVFRTLWPASTAYVRDYAYVPEFDWAAAEMSKDTIIAYERVPWHQGLRMVAFADMRVTDLMESDFLTRAAEQGLEPNPP